MVKSILVNKKKVLFYMNKFPLWLTNILTLVLTGLLGAALLVLLRPWQPLLPQALIVVSATHEASTGLLAPFGVGFERELVERLWKQIAEDDPEIADEAVQWRSAASREEALTMIRTGQAHIAVGFGGEMTGLATPPPSVAPVSTVADGKQGRVGLGPVYYHARTLSVTLPLPSLDKVLGSDTDVSRQFLDARSWAVWEPFVGASGLDSARAENADSADNTEASPQEAFRWFWNRDKPWVDKQVNKFWAALTQEDNTVLDQLEERYYGYLPDSTNPYAVLDFLDIVRKRVPRYSRVIAQAADRADIDPLLFTAVIIQESRMNEGTVSHTGVQGIMQLTRETARYLKVDRMNPTQALRGGARYLRMLWKDLEDQGLEEWDRWFFTLAAFNQGPRRLEGARQLSRKLGGSGNTWRELKEIYPLLAQTKYAAMVGQKTCRGSEAVQFVERVRWYYHILRGLVTLARPEAQNLAPLLGRAVTNVALGF